MITLEGIVFPVRLPQLHQDKLIRTRMKTFWCGALFRQKILVSLVLPMMARSAVKRSLQARAAGVRVGTSTSTHWELIHLIRAYFSGRRIPVSLQIDLSGYTQFQQKVLRAAQKIPYGTTCSYAELARRAGAPKAVRAVGTVMANNPIPLVIPCHRVIKSDGSLGNFSGGVGPALKKIMLLLERPISLVHN